MGHGVANESVTVFKKTLKSKEDPGKRQISSIRGWCHFLQQEDSMTDGVTMPLASPPKPYVDQVYHSTFDHAILIAEIHNSESWRSGPREDEERRKNKRKKKKNKSKKKVNKDNKED